MTDSNQVDEEPDELDVAAMTLCVACAKHPSLKRFVQTHAVQGPVCGICQSAGAHDACDLARKNDLTNLIKALVRFHFNEYDYNRHWGGDDEPEGLLANPNPILEDATTVTHQRSPDRSADFLYDLFASEPYPPVDEGISVYAGHDEGVRLLAFAIQERESDTLRDLRARLLKENPFDVAPAVDALFDRIGDRIAREIPADALYFRARIGVAQRYQRQSENWRPVVVSQPFEGAALGAPPPHLATAGRLNHAGVAFLYLASDLHTAAAEVRPHPGHRLSIGTFRAQRPLRVATFDPDIAAFCGNERDLDLFHFIHSADQAMASPVVPGAGARYSISQLIADGLRQRGFDGVAFKSSVAEGTNLCVFRPESFAYVTGSAVVQTVRGLSYRMEASPMLLVPDAGDWPLDP